MRAVFARFATSVRDALRIWWLAPIIPLIAALPEFGQHVVEIRLGMFDSIETMRTIGQSAARWGVGYIKIAGLFLAIIATIRFQAARLQDRSWWSAQGVNWRLLGIALALNILVSLVGEAILEGVAPLAFPVPLILQIVLSIASLPLLVLLVAALTGDRGASIAGVYRHGWLAALRIAIFAAALFLPLQWLHMMNHQWAVGQSEPIVWTLMVFDSLLVGLIATGLGTAIHHGYRPLSKHEGQDFMSAGRT